MTRVGLVLVNNYHPSNFCHSWAWHWLICLKGINLPFTAVLQQEILETDETLQLLRAVHSFSSEKHPDNCIAPSRSCSTLETHWEIMYEKQESSICEEIQIFMLDISQVVSIELSQLLNSSSFVPCYVSRGNTFLKWEHEVNILVTTDHDFY